jgi:hypothetical protein
MGFDGRDEREQLVEVVVVDLVRVPGDPLVDPLEVGAGVGADGEAGLHEERGREAGGGGLAVGAGEVEDRVLELG